MSGGILSLDSDQIAFLRKGVINSSDIPKLKTFSPTQQYEYVVTLKAKEDLSAFYDDMETPGGNLYIPNREVSLTLRRPISRSTHYKLTPIEAKTLSEDPRVLAVELSLAETPWVKPRPLSQSSDNWNKSGTLASSHRNWSLLRCYEGSDVLEGQWGTGGTPDRSATINLTNSGKNVDVVIVDGHILPDHPEFAVNEDGTGGSRVVQYNWFQHNAETGFPYTAATTYLYSYLTTGDAPANNNHGNHVASSATGNRQGWARNANIYNISPYGDGSNYIKLYELLYSSSYGPFAYWIFDYIRAFHANKPINPETGRKNPTIVNNSWGFSNTIRSDECPYFEAPGTGWGLTPSWASGGYTSQQVGAQILGVIGYFDIESNGTNISDAGYLPTPIWNMLFGARNAAIDADVQDAIDEGIIIIGAAGNEYNYGDEDSNGIHWNNRWILGDSLGAPGLYTNRGVSPGNASNAISVGAIDNVIITPDAGKVGFEQKAIFSNYGPQLDIMAPGGGIMGAAWYDSTSTASIVADSRNDFYSLMKLSGTSQASPQVTGVLACALSTYPNMNQNDAIQYMHDFASAPDQVYDKATLDSSVFLGDYYSLRTGPNLYLKYYKERADEGAVTPKKNFFKRPTTGITYPRTRIKRRG